MDCKLNRIKNDINALNNCTTGPGPGITRLTWTPSYMKAYNYIINELQNIGAEVKICLGGNIRGRIKGKDPNKPAVMSGSHIDTVKNGGRFDGQVGTISALEAARVIVENRIPHQHPIDIVVFPEEEGTRFGIGLGASSVWTGKASVERLYQAHDVKGITYHEAMQKAGVIVNNHETLNSEKIKCMLEVHIEQSVVLYEEGLKIGVVESIAGMKWCDLTIKGVANHAGGTPMRFRHDALQGAVRIIAELENILTHDLGPNAVGTCGSLKVFPGVDNVIPGQVNFTFDIRDSEVTNLDKLISRISNFTKQVCNERGLEWEVIERHSVDPVRLPYHLVDLIQDNSVKRNQKVLRMMSGALHDSCMLAHLTDVGMIFIPSKDGRSHCPEEWTDWEDIKLGADILLDSIIKLAS